MLSKVLTEQESFELESTKSHIISHIIFTKGSKWQKGKNETGKIVNYALVISYALKSISYALKRVDIEAACLLPTSPIIFLCASVLMV